MIDWLIVFADRKAVEDALVAMSSCCDGGADTAFRPENQDQLRFPVGTPKILNQDVIE
jgi:hypothetical protein